MVLSQLAGLAIGNGEFVIKVAEVLKQPTIILAAIFSAFAFILGYFPKYRESANKE